MRAWQLSSFGLEGLEWVERPTPTPGPGEVLVGIRAISLNERDLLTIKGLEQPEVRLPRIPCSDGAGEVVAVGEGVTFWRPGDRVLGMFLQHWLDGPLNRFRARGLLGSDRDGMLTDYIVLRESGLVAIPEHLSFQEAATLPFAALTAWNALDAGNLKPGSTVLIEGADGVSLFALQLAKLRGARVLGLFANEEGLNRARSLGLDAGCNLGENPEWPRWAFEETSGEGVDLVVENGAEALSGALAAVRFGGTIAQTDPRTNAPDALTLSLLLRKTARLQGIFAGSRRDFIEMNRAIALAELRPVGEEFPWSQTREVLERLEKGPHFGKMVLTVG